MANAEFIAPLSLPVMSLSGLGTAAGYDIAFVGEDLAGVVYKSAGGVATGYIQLDFGSDVTVTRLMLFGLSGAPAAATIRTYSSTQAQGATYATASIAVPLFAGTSRLVNGDGVCFITVTAPASRYWRIEFGALANAQIQIGRLVMGAAILQARNFKFGGEFGIKSLSSSKINDRGVWLRQRRKKRLRTIGISFPATSQDEIETIISPFIETIADDTGVALITNPAPNALIERRAYFGQLIEAPSVTWRNARNWEWRADLVSLF
jgi:hypothetical protein